MLQFLPLLLAAAGTGVSMYAQNQAAKKQQEIMRQGMERTRGLRDQATDLAMKRANDFNAEDRNQEEQEIADEQTAQFEAAAKPIDVNGLEIGKTVEGTGLFQTEKAKKAVQTQQSLRQLAQIMGRLGAAGQLRQNEAIRFGDTSQQINQLGQNANNMARVDELQASSVRPNAGLQMLGSLASSYGMGQLAGGLGGAGSAGGWGGSYSGSNVVGNTALANNSNFVNIPTRF